MSMIQQSEVVFRSQSRSQNICVDCMDFLKQFRVQEHKVQENKVCWLYKIISGIKQLSQERLMWLYNIFSLDNSYEICQTHFYPLKFYKASNQTALCEQCYNETINDTLQQMKEILNQNLSIQLMEEEVRKKIEKFRQNIDDVKKLEDVSIDKINLPDIKDFKDLEKNMISFKEKMDKKKNDDQNNQVRDDIQKQLYNNI